MTVPEDITLLWTDDNWGNIRRLPVGNETSRSGGAGVYYHFDYVGDPRDYKVRGTTIFEMNQTDTTSFSGSTLSSIRRPGNSCISPMRDKLDRYGSSMLEISSHLSFPSLTSSILHTISTAGTKTALPNGSHFGHLVSLVLKSLHRRELL